MKQKIVKLFKKGLEKVKVVGKRIWEVLKTVKFIVWNQGYYSIGAELAVTDSKVNLEFTLLKFCLHIHFTLEGK